MIAAVSKSAIFHLHIFKPETVLTWQRKLIAKRWTYLYRTPGRRSVSAEIRNLILNMKNEMALTTVIATVCIVGPISWNLPPFSTLMSLNEEIKDYWDDMPESAPDEYDRPEGTPKLVDVDEKLYNEKYSILSDCFIAMPPSSLTCVDGKCTGIFQ